MASQLLWMSLMVISLKRFTAGAVHPHIIIIVADDLGFNDVGFHGSTQIPTPNIDALAYSGIILQNYYVQPICTPSRSALLTGKHPIHTGLQHATIGASHPYGLSLSETLLPSYLAPLGYRLRHVGKWHLGFIHKEYTPTFRGFESHLGYWSGRIDYLDHTAFENHATIGGSHPYGLSLSETLLPSYLAPLGYRLRHVGKWHLGFFHKEYTPTFRGFESHLGYWSGRIDYLDHTAFENPGYWGYDFRRNMTVANDCYGKYATDLFTEEAVDLIEKHNASQPMFLYLAHLAVHSANEYAPLQAPKEIVAKFSYIKDEKRRKFAGMLWKLDESVGQVVKALDDKQMLQDSIILFTTDNGGPAGGFDLNVASNWPLRGVKASLWEGGTRGAGFLWSPMLTNPGRISHEMIHITDWLPTLISAAGGDISSLGNIDGLDQWNSLRLQHPSPRKEILVNIDPRIDNGAVRVGDWKLIFRPQVYGAHWDSWFGPTGRNESAPETNLDVILAMVLNSSTASSVKKIIPNAYKNIKALRENAEVHCDPLPANATKSCNSKESPCLFHIPSDPCEYNNVAALHPDIVSITMNILQKYNATAIPPANKPFDPAANPKYWGYAWTNWMDYERPSMENDNTLNDNYAL